MSSGSEEEFVEEEDSDDEPLSKLKANGKKSNQSDSEEGEEPDDDDDEDDAWEDEGTGSSKKRKPAEETDDSDDDDIPLSALASNKKPKNGTKKVATPSKAKKVTKKASKTKTKTKAKTPTKKESNDSYQSASAALYGSECKKGLLIQRLLCRWWFGIAWPDPATLPDEPPLNYDALDGFPGVYVCTQGDEVGKIRDMRDMEECPNFKNFSKKTSAELQTLLINAIEKQKEELIKVDGKGSPTEDELNTMLKWANKVNPSQADKEAAKVLKAAGLKLD